MNNLELTLRVTTLLIVVFLAGMTGYAFRSGRTRRKQLRIRELKNEIMYYHAQILELEKEFVMLESQMKETTQTPVLTLKTAVKEYSEGYNWVSEGMV